MYACMYVFMNVYVCIHMYVCMYEYIYVIYYCTSERMNVCIFI